MQGAKNEGEGASMQTYMTEFAFRRKRSRSPVMYMYVPFIFYP